MHLDTQGKTEDVPEIAIAITYETHGIDVIGSQLIKERDALDALTHIVRYLVFEAFTEGDVRTDASRERIIAVFVLGRLLGPECFFFSSCCFWFSSLMPNALPDNIIMCRSLRR